ncbi:streptophobe family protein [Streptomyces sp. NPDC048664]|uniref:streptophobe family protein n=1 Tax=Streptomyces sp. NPDC048664 TaxID=3154505 RepID=UPI00343D887F
MSVPTSRSRSGSGSARTAGPPPRAVGPLRNAAEGAGAALCAVAAMAALSGLGLYLLGAGSYGSLWSLASAVTSLAVGASARTGSGAPSARDGSSPLAGLLGGGGGPEPSVSGSVDLVPLGVTLAGSLVLWWLFSRGLGRRRVTAGDLAARGLAAGVSALIAVACVAHGAHGTVRVPGSVLGGQGGGAGGAARQLVADFEVSAGAAVVGALLWVAVVLALGCVISRRVPWPTGPAGRRPGNAWASSLSSLVRVLLGTVAVATAAMVVAGVTAAGRPGVAAGAALLLAPNAVAVCLTSGLGVPWTASRHRVSGDGGGALAELLGRLRGRPTATGAADRTEHLRDLSVGGVPLWPAALVVVVLALLVCGCLAARAADPARVRPLPPFGGRYGRQLAGAGRLGVVTAVVLGAAALLAQASGQLTVSVFDTVVGGTRVRLGGAVGLCPPAGLLVGALAGGVGSLLYGAVTARFPMLGAGTRTTAGAGAPAASGTGRRATSGSVEEPVGKR